MQLAIDLPEPEYEYLSRLAALTNQPLAALVIQSITGNLPPSVESAPLEIQPELLALQTESVETLRQIAQSQTSSEQQQRYIFLMERNQDSHLNPEEQQELLQLCLRTDQLMLKKAHACAILRWRGQPIRDLSQLAPN